MLSLKRVLSVFVLGIGLFVNASVNISDYHVYYVESEEKLIPELEAYLNENISELWTISEITVIEKGKEESYAAPNAMFITLKNHIEQNYYGDTYSNVDHYTFCATYHYDLKEATTEINSYPSEKVSVNKFQHFTTVSDWAKALTLILQSYLLPYESDRKILHDKTLVIRKDDLHTSVDPEELSSMYCCTFKLVDHAEYVEILNSESSEYALFIASTKMDDDKIRLGVVMDGTTGSDRTTKRYIIDLETGRRLYSKDRTLTASGSFGLMKKDLKELK